MKRALVVLLTALVTGLTAHAVAAGQAGGERSTAVPHRIVSLSPTATETLFAIGAGSQVIAVDDQSDYPKTAPRTSLSGFTPNVEAIAAYRPDLVVISYSPKGFAESLAKARIRVLLQGPASTLTAAYAQMLELGRLTGHVKGANVLVKGMKARIASLLKAAPRASLSVYNELTPDYYSATSSVDHRSCPPALRSAQHRRSGEHERCRRGAALGRVDRRREPRPDRARRHALLRPEQEQGRRSGPAGRRSRESERERSW